MEIATIPGGFLAPKDTCIGKWQVSIGRLDCCGELLPLCVALLRPGDTILDCGAFDGDHTIAYSEKVGPSGTVIAVEPGEIAFQCLEHNARLFKYPNTQCFKLALADRPIKLAHFPDPNLGGSECHPSENGILSTTIDFMVDMLNIRRLDFIKMDCEGWEAKILAGARRTIQTFKPTMVLEVQKGCLQKIGSSVDDILSELKDLNYSHAPIEAPPVNEEQYDLLCRPI